MFKTLIETLTLSWYEKLGTDVIFTEAKAGVNRAPSSAKTKANTKNEGRIRTATKPMCLRHRVSGNSPLTFLRVVRP